MLLRGQFVELQIIKHLNYPDWLKKSNADFYTESLTYWVIPGGRNAAHPAIQVGPVLYSSVSLV